MPRLIFKNNFEVALAQPTTTSDTTITIRPGSDFPTLGANERVVATIVDAATGLQFEIVTVTAVIGNVLTVQRAQEGTAARAWAAGDMLSIRTTAASLTNTVRNFGDIPSGINLNALTGTWFGQYYQRLDSGASSALNYPISQAGVLEILQTGVASESCVQRYTTYSLSRSYQRRYVASTNEWSDWVFDYSSASIIPISNGGTGQTTIQGMKSAFGFGTVADQNIVPTSMGGTGSGDNAQAWLNIRPQGATPLAGDPVNDYDAATKRWVENLVNTGTVGPSMNGVMNYGVGDFHLRDSRAYIQPYEVVADGQLLNRADWPELWAYAQMLSPIADADWLADPLKRGNYSLGNGTTTFRVPDRNGVQASSVSGLFGRGDGGASANNGLVYPSGAPNITGSTEVSIITGFSTVAPSRGSGVFVPTDVVASSTKWATTGTGVTYLGSLSLDASLSNAIYGRTVSEIRPNSFIGVWVIRASGGFAAANTSWSVINADATAPANGTTVKGGKVRSVYKVGTSEYGVAELQSSVSTDGTGVRTVGAEVVVTDATSGIATSKTIKLGTVDGLTGGEIGSIITVRGAGLQPKLVASHLDYNPVLGGNAIWIVGMTGTENIMQYVTEVTGQYYSLTTVFRVAGQQQFWSQTSTGRYLTPLGELAIQGSDVRIKEGFEKPKEGAWDRVKAIGICEFKYKGQNIVHRGFLAQQMGDIDPIYTFEGGTAHDDEGKEFEILNVNDKAVLADVITVMQMMQDKIESLESQIAALEAAK